MIKKEFKNNLKSLVIWTSLILVFFLIVYIIYPSIMSNDNSEMLNQMLKMFPEEMLKAFNMDISSISRVSGWFKSEGYIIYVLIIGIYSGILGSSILLKEENDKTIEIVNSLPIKRRSIVTSRLIVGLVNISIATISFSAFNIIGMYLTNDLDLGMMLMLTVSPLVIFYSIFTLSLFISTFFKKTRNTFGISILLVFLSYFFQVLSGMSSKVEVLKYFSIFTVADARYIINNNAINLVGIICGLIIIGISIYGTYYKYNKKEFC